ncbi:hypothetical protein AVEN_187713-1 [Araneus ventricosus]|uniref:Uncharacterized protein n=1 Tax=Araneus ventricosus TaxID=182803 RepID=A0A4Y2C2P4_ARAVE|nr:hypothetical protein AVEN_187713-1 [Araneus ventricosus]
MYCFKFASKSFTGRKKISLVRKPRLYYKNTETLCAAEGKLQCNQKYYVLFQVCFKQFYRTKEDISDQEAETTTRIQRPCLLQKGNCNAAKGIKYSFKFASIILTGRRKISLIRKPRLYYKNTETLFAAERKLQCLQKYYVLFQVCFDQFYRTKEDISDQEAETLLQEYRDLVCCRREIALQPKVLRIVSSLLQTVLLGEERDLRSREHVTITSRLKQFC